MPERMDQGKQGLNIKRNLHTRYRDNNDTDGRKTDGGRTMDKFWFHELCWHSQTDGVYIEKNKEPM